jgi:hypothetical protein
VFLQKVGRELNIIYRAPNPHKTSLTMTSFAKNKNRVLTILNLPDVATQTRAAVVN